jgi:hypothetical protein
VGRQLVLNEMRSTLARMARKFDAVLGESCGYGKSDRECKDRYVLKTEAFWLKFTRRH